MSNQTIAELIRVQWELDTLERQEIALGHFDLAARYRADRNEAAMRERIALRLAIPCDGCERHAKDPRHTLRFFAPDDLGSRTGMWMHVDPAGNAWECADQAREEER